MKVTMRSAVLVVCGAAACSSSGSNERMPAGESTINTTLDFLPASSYASSAATLVLDDAGNPSMAHVVVANIGGADSCTPLAPFMAGGNANAANLFYVNIAIGAANPGQVIAPGTYTHDQSVVASYRFTDGNCGTASEGTATDATVEIDGIDTSIYGVIDMTFPAGRLIVSFDAPFCSGSTATGSDEGGGLVCVQYPACPTSREVQPDTSGATCLML
jgi:hypothetical protein